MLNFRYFLLGLFGLIVLIGVGLSVQQAYAQTAPLSRYEEKKRQMNENNAAIMTSGMTCTCARNRLVQP